MELNEKRQAGAKIIDISHLFLAKHAPERVLGLAKVPSDEFIAPHFNKRRGLGDGLYCVRIYDNSGRPHAFMSGVISEMGTGDPDVARKSFQTQLASELSSFYSGVASKEVKAPADICTLRNEHMSFLAAKCSVGMVAAGWYDTRSKKSINGMHMLAFFMYTLGVMNLQDAVLKVATINHLPYAEGIGDFNVEAVQSELIALAVAFDKKAQPCGSR